MTREEILKKYKHTNNNEVYFDFEAIQEKLKGYLGYGALWEYSVSHQKLVLRLALNTDKISTDKFVDSLYIYCNETSSIVGKTKIPNASFEVKKAIDEEKEYIIVKELQGRLTIECASCYMIINKKYSED